jgi:hypothetical protein
MRRDGQARTLAEKRRRSTFPRLNPVMRSVKSTSVSPVAGFTASRRRLRSLSTATTAKCPAPEEIASCCPNHPLKLEEREPLGLSIKQNSGRPPFPNASGSELSGTHAAQAPSGASEKRRGGLEASGSSSWPQSSPPAVMAPGTKSLLAFRTKPAPRIAKSPASQIARSRETIPASDREHAGLRHAPASAPWISFLRVTNHILAWPTSVPAIQQRSGALGPETSYRPGRRTL